MELAAGTRPSLLCLPGQCLIRCFARGPWKYRIAQVRPNDVAIVPRSASSQALHMDGKSQTLLHQLRRQGRFGIAGLVDPILVRTLIVTFLAEYGVYTLLVDGLSCGFIPGCQRACCEYLRVAWLEATFLRVACTPCRDSSKKNPI